MAKNHCKRYCNLIDEAGFDQFAHLDTLQMVIEHMPDAELVENLKARRKGGRQDWPVEAMLNAFYALLVLQYRSMADLQRNLGRNPTLMRICGFELKPNAEKKFRVPSTSALSRFWKLLGQVEGATNAIAWAVSRRRPSN